MLALLASPALAFTIKTTPSGHEVHWTERRLSLSVGASGDAARDAKLERALERALGTWAGTGTVELSASGPDPEARVGFERGNVVSWSGGHWSDASEVLAQTLVHYQTESGEIIDADIVLNDVTLTWADEGDGVVWESYDLGNTLTHEVGHALGLGHSQFADATMFGSSSPMETRKRDLSDDDVDAIQTLYAPLEVTAGAPASVAAAGCANVRGELSPGLLAAALAWLAARRRAIRR